MKWHHSLYWRIAVGFVACLALLLLVQAMLFVWVVSRSSSIPNQPPDRFAQTVALDAGQALERDPSLDLAQYLRQEYGRDSQPFFVLTRDGSSIAINGSFPDPLVHEARERFEALLRRPFDTRNPDAQGRPFDGRSPDAQGRPFGRRNFPAPDTPYLQGRPFDRGGFGRGGPRPFRPAVIRAHDEIVALVVVPPAPPFMFLLGRYAPALGLVALATLVVGAILAAAVIFGPARKRLRSVEDAARRLGGGDLSARAPTKGRDEVAAVATAFNAMADDLAIRADALAAADRARRQLLADVSHELTTPVTAMRGYLDTLRMPELDLDEPTRARYLGIISDETGRLERIIGDLLDLARLEGGGGTLNVDDVPIEELFERVTARHGREAQEAGIAIRTAIASDTTHVRGDRDRLEQALQNLAANALRYAPSGSAITLDARREGGFVVLSVADEGPGIPPEHLSHVFDRFFKADASRASGQGAGGSGLGLSIVKAIVERHGGNVSVDSAPGRTVFRLKLRIKN
ncbi:MAG TPA: HAMP domain-containing sensor histidine kinase [Vicinamibacterales bacterium]